MNAHTVGVRSAPAPTAPNVAVGIAAHAVSEARREVSELLAAGDAGTRAIDVEYGYISRIRSIGRTGVDDVKFFEVAVPGASPNAAPGEACLQSKYPCVLEGISFSPAR